MLNVQCKTEFEVDFIIEKYNYNFNKEELEYISTYLNEDGFVHLIKMTEHISTYCSGICINCVFSDTCKSYSSTYINASNLMREEKLKRILE